jgi:hypothetical protein
MPHLEASGSGDTITGGRRHRKSAKRAASPHHRRSRSRSHSRKSVLSLGGLVTGSGAGFTGGEGITGGRRHRRSSSRKSSHKRSSHRK